MNHDDQSEFIYENFEKSFTKVNHYYYYLLGFEFTRNLYLIKNHFSESSGVDDSLRDINDVSSLINAYKHILFTYLEGLSSI